MIQYIHEQEIALLTSFQFYKVNLKGIENDSLSRVVNNVYIFQKKYPIKNIRLIFRPRVLTKIMLIIIIGIIIHYLIRNEP